MSSASPAISYFSFRLKPGEFHAAFGLWGAYIAALTAYCMLYQAIVASAPPDFTGSFIWAVRDWGIWPLITPMVFQTLKRYDNRPTLALAFGYLKSGATILIAVLAFRAAVDYLTQAQGFAPTVVIYFPRYLAALAVVIVVWRLLLRPRPIPEPVEQPQELRAETSPPQYPDNLLVSKGHDKCLIRVDRIQSVSAAGNYVEILSENQDYLMRATMKQVEELLPPSSFIRVHRSHIANVEAIDRIKTQPSGNGTVHLRCGKVLGMSKAYNAQLQQLGRKGLH